MDDFSWGNTRVVVGEGKDKTVITSEGEYFDDSMIPLKKFSGESCFLCFLLRPFLVFLTDGSSPLFTYRLRSRSLGEHVEAGVWIGQGRIGLRIDSSVVEGTEATEESSSSSQFRRWLQRRLSVRRIARWRRLLVSF